jgi:SAM-dependent methyltransferase
MAHGPHPHHHGYKFDIAKLDKLRDPERLRYMNPAAVWDVIGRSTPRVLVEIGVGIGFFAIPLARRMPEGLVYGCDISDEMLDQLRAALRAEGVNNVTPLRSEEVRIPLADQIADVVFMANLHHELDDPEGLLDECRRLLRPGGRLAVIDWKPEETPTGPPVTARIPPERVRAQLEAAGFQAVKAHAIFPYHYFLTGEKPGGC